MSAMIPRTEKRCPRCETIKPASAFHKSRSSYDGLVAYCKPCMWQWKTRNKNAAPEGQKHCSHCQIAKPYDQFFNDKSTRDGYGYECRPCYQERMNRSVSLYEPDADRHVGKTRSPYRIRPKESLPEGYKRCLKCDEVKPTTDFGRATAKKDGIATYCRKCVNNRPRLPIILPEEKLCPKCGETKSANEFYFSSAGRSAGLSSYCRDCSQVDARGRVTYSYLKKRRTDLRRYGLTIEEYERLLQEQDGKCASCGHPETTIMRGKVVPLAIDHCHVTDAVRGLLCRRCNQALGMLCEDPERIEALLKYTMERVLY